MPELDTPVRTDAELVAHVEELVAEAIRRQTWLLFFDEHDRPLPVVVPVDGLPVFPEPEDAEVFVGHVDGFLRATGAASIAVVWERPGGGALRDADAVWVRTLHETCGAVRAQLHCTDDGVRLLDPAAEALAA